MAKILVDQGLAETIKTIRVQNGVAAKDLAEKMKKSRSYVSKLEKGGIATIDSEDLITILKFISRNNQIDEIIDHIFKTVSIRYTKEEIDNMLWFDNFDKVYRRIPIPVDFAKTYSESLQQHGISVEKLTDEINKNIFIPKEIKKDEYPNNTWFQYKDGTYIFMNVSNDRIHEILDGKREKSNYVTLFAIALYYLRLTEYVNVDSFDVDIIQEMNEKAKESLAHFKIYTLAGKREMIEKAANSEEIINSLSLHDKTNIDVISRFNPLIQLYSDYDVVSANNLIGEFTKNLEWEAPYIMEIAGLPFYKLNHCSFRLKKKMLEDIKNILQKALDLPENEKKREEY